MRVRSFRAVGVLVGAGLALSCGGAADRPIEVKTPTPTAVPTPKDVCETLGKGLITAECHASKNPQLGDEVEAAIDKLIADKPELFDLTREQKAGTGRYYVKDHKAYLK